MTLTEAQYRNDMVKTALNQIGRPYRDSALPTNWPPSSFDCSTFIHWLNAKYMIDVDQGVMRNLIWPPVKPSPWHKYPGYTGTQMTTAKRLGAGISYSAIKPGDALYYEKPGGYARHVVMYIGGGKIVHASTPSAGTIVGPIVPPGVLGHSGKKLVLCVSATRLARACGYRFATPTPIPAPKPPAGQRTVILQHILYAIAKDGPAADGHTTYKAEVMIVEDALAKEGLLSTTLVDGSAGTSSFGRGSAYNQWEKKLGYAGDGLPDMLTLPKLGARHTFNVV